MVNDLKENLAERIGMLKREKNAVILAHYYQTPDIQDIADYVGDSLGLSRQAAGTEADIIVFAGVHFMAETAKILNPAKTVLIPDPEAGCSLADSCPPEEFSRFIARHPDHAVISYINCSAAVKTMSDIICTSGNALKVVESFPAGQKLIFAPDRNLGAWLNGMTGRNMVLWDGVCEVHEVIRQEEVIRLKQQHPDAKLIAHPECKGTILALADYIGSTTGLLDYTVKSPEKKFIVATETGILHQMKKASPDKEFIIVPADETCSCNDCPYMKKNSLLKIYECLAKGTHEIILPEEVIEKARIPIERMLAIS